MVQTTGATTRPPLTESAPGPIADCAAEGEAISISCHKDEIPEFVGAELDRLYGNLYSSLVHFRASKKLNDSTSTYVVRRGGEISAVFLFKIEKGRVQVLNEVISLAERDIDRFARYVFSNFGSVEVISFRAVHIDIRALPFHCQHFNYLEDIVVALPDNEDTYIESLGKRTRRNMRRYLKYLRRDHPSFSYEYFEAGSIDEQYVRDIIVLNHARMSGKKKMSNIDEHETEKMLDLVRSNGLVCIAKIDGRVAAGAIIYRVGGNYFLLTLAHDSRFNAYCLGALCCYLCICESIRRGAREFHFLWGRYDYKYWFGGIQRDLDYLAIYRSRTHFILNGVFAFNVWARAIRRQVMLWLHQAKQKDTLMSRLAIFALNGVRSMKSMKQIMFKR